MKIERLPIAFLAVGLVFKTLLVFMWRHGGSPGVLNLLIYYDPGARYFAERVTRLFFDYGGITLAPGSNTFFDVSLVIGFGIECLVLGFVVRWFLSRFRHSEGPRSMPTTR